MARKECKSQAFLSGLSTGFKAPSGKARRLIVTHIGSGEYHENMNAEVYEEYFAQMLDSIPSRSVIVTNNGSYHFWQIGWCPTTA
ncbi:hypothetical protein NQ317_018870 [Molorchus minor]|uniref:Uncharacterized protein n=1 Tax=Molorchus minor TaxID=1323400 RepID=A0ABQ9JGM5_9CUCU|nr:hypothetical protein NQ317_018870 [Molorchus minor]